MAEIRNHNGKPTIFIDGKPYPPMMATIRTMNDEKDGIIFDKDYFYNLGKSGIKIYFLICDTTWLKPNSIKLFDTEARQLLDAIPDAYIIPRIGLHPPNDWIEAHPEECVTYADGSKPSARLITESYFATLPHHYSLCSQKWREDAGKALTETWNELMRLPYADRIVGCFLAAGGTSEWYYIAQNPNLSQKFSRGHSLAFKREFSSYLKEVYGTNENLQKHWKNPNATIENPPIPELEKSYFNKDADKIAFQAIQGGVIANTSAGHAEGNGTNLGSFIDFDKNKDVYDFYRAWNLGTANSVLYFAKIIKELTPDRLTGAFYGSQGCINFVSSGTSGGTVKVLNSEYIDFLAAPGCYENRLAGGAEGQRQVQDSFTLHDKIYIVEQDTRTFAELNHMKNKYMIYDLTDTVDVMKREFGRNICEDVQAWWFDQLIGGKRYKHTELYKLIDKQQKIAEQAYSLPRQKKSEIAFIFDEETMQGVSFQTTMDSVELLRNYEIYKIGAPVDQYYHNDLLDPNMPSYKLYVFVNTYIISPKECEAIKQKLKKDNAVAVWLYAPGFISPMADKKASTEYMKELTGMSFNMIDDAFDAVFRFNGKLHKISEKLDKRALYGKFDRKRTLVIGNSPDRHRDTYLWPLFYVDDSEATHIAHYLTSGYPSISVKESDGYTSVYYGSKCIKFDVLRSLAEFAGCHVYMESDDVIYVGANYVTFHASSSGKKMVHFPKKVSVYEVYEDKLYAENTDTVEFDCYLGETKMFYYC